MEDDCIKKDINTHRNTWISEYLMKTKQLIRNIQYPMLYCYY
jgi:hypothetical protein